MSVRLDMVSFLFTAVAVLGGCREVIVVDPEGEGGQDHAWTVGGHLPGSSGTSPTGNGGSDGQGGDDTTSSPSGSPSSVSTGTVEDLCDAFCSATKGCVEDCQKVCRTYQASPCESQGGAFVACLSREYDAATCSSFGCDEELSALLACREGTTPECDGASCAGGGAACSCTAECTDGQHKAICNTEGSVSSCTCYLNATPIANCQVPPPGDGSECNLSVGCCAQVFGTL